MTSWWNKNVESRLDDFKSWVGDHNQASKVYCRKYIVEKQYKSMVDCGCGLATDFFALKNDGYSIAYTGIDSCKFIVDTNRSNGIDMVEAELEQPLPIEDNKYDVAYCREVLEHLSYYENAINEFIRIASKEVIIVWFIKPIEEWQWEEEIKDKILRMKKEHFEEQYKINTENGLTDPLLVKDIDIVISDDNKEINYWKPEDLYHNKYDKNKLENFILSNPKVEKIFWNDVCDEPYPVQCETDNKPNFIKSVLHIVLKEK